jgi:hypothetical protein
MYPVSLTRNCPGPKVKDGEVDETVRLWPNGQFETAPSDRPIIGEVVCRNAGLVISLDNLVDQHRGPEPDEIPERRAG